MEVGVDPLDHMEDDLHIPPLQTEYPPSYDAPHFDSTTYQSEPPSMPSYTQPPHYEQSPYYEQPPAFEQPQAYSPFPDPHYTPPPEQPSLHELQDVFHALREDIHGMREDIIGLRES